VRSANSHDHRGNRGRPASWLLLSAFVILADQVSKVYIARHYLEFEFTRILPVLDITSMHNVGAAFSFLASASGGSVGYSSARRGGQHRYTIWLLKAAARHAWFARRRPCARARAVVDARGVARGDAAVLVEGGLETLQRIERRAVPRILVVGEDERAFAAGDLDRDDLFLKRPAFCAASSSAGWRARTGPAPRASPRIPSPRSPR